MAATSDDDVQDGDTTAAGIAPAASSADEEEEDRTVQQPPDPKLRSAIAKELNQPARATPRAGVAVPSASKPNAAMPTNVTSKRMTVVGLAPPALGSAAAPPTVRAPTSISPLATTMDKKVGPTSTNPTTSGPASAPRPGMAPKPVPASTKAPVAKALENEADEEDASITATAPAPRVGPAAAASTGAVASKPPPLPLTVPGQVQIREMGDDEPLDETEVRTVVSIPPDDTAPPVPAQKLGAAPAELEELEEEELEDSVTTQAPSAVLGGRLPEEYEPKTSPPVRAPAPTPAAGRSPFDQPPIRSAAATQAEGEEDDDAYGAEDSVTTRGPAVPDFRLDDSVATDQPPESSGRWPSPVTPNKGVPHRAVTMSQAMGLPPKNAGLPPAIEDGTEGTTNRFAGQGPPAMTPNSGPMGASGGANKKGPPRPNATQQSPVALNVPPKVGAPAEEEEYDLAEDNRTAVMMNAPVSPNAPSGSARAARPQMAGGMATHASAAALRATAPVVDKASSESGLRVAPAPHAPHAPPPPQHVDERGSLGAMMAGALHGQPPHQQSERGSGVAPREYPSQPLPVLQPHQVQHHYPASEPNLALGATIPVGSPLMAAQLGTAGMGPNGQPMSQMPQVQQYDFGATIKKPRYGLLVGLVAMLSFAIPLVLFLWLHQNVQEPYNREPATRASEKRPLVLPPQVKSAVPAASSTTKPPKRR